MTVYIRILGRDVWHMHPLCHHMKRLMRETDGIDWRERNSKPKTGEFCNECQAKTRADKRTQAKRKD